MAYKIGLLYGDGIGPEITKATEAVKSGYRRIIVAGGV